MPIFFSLKSGTKRAALKQIILNPAGPDDVRVASPYVPPNPLSPLTSVGVEY